MAQVGISCALLYFVIQYERDSGRFSESLLVVSVQDNVAFAGLRDKRGPTDPTKSIAQDNQNRLR